MNKTFFLVAILLATSCRSLDMPSCWIVPNSPIHTKLLPLEKIEFSSDKFLMDYVDKNICETEGEKFGYLRCIKKGETIQKGFFLSYWTGLISLGTTWILGAPFFIMESELELDFEILNNKSERIAKFSSYAKTRVPAAFYYGYKPASALYKSQLDCINKAYQQIRDSLNTDVAEAINSELRKSGKLVGN